MAYSDWIVTVTRLAGVPNPAPNPYDHQPIDPAGVFTTEFTLVFDSKKVANLTFSRTERGSMVTRAFLAEYARQVLDVVEANLALRQDDSLLGRLDILPPAPAPPSPLPPAARKP